MGKSHQKKPLSKKMKISLIAFLIISPLTIIAIYYTFFDNLNKSTYNIRTRDNMTLATDVYLPEGEGPFPVVLYRTPYGKSSDKGPTNLLQYGVAIVSQDHRGCHDSTGLYTAFGSDGFDAEDTVAWLKQQSWFNGKYATWGASARGITQYMQVTHLTDVQCQYIQVGTPDLYSIAMFQGGAPRKQLAEDWLASISHRDYYNEIFNHPLSTDSYASDRRIDASEWSSVTWPSIHMGGWYDCFGQGTIDGFCGYQYQGGVGGKDNAKLIMGPWTHTLSSQNAGELQYPTNAKSDPTSENLFQGMFAEKLLGTTQYGDYRTMANVTYYVMGDLTTNSTQWNRWATADAWPIPATNTTLYLASNSTISLTKSAEAKNFTYIFDPHNPIDTKGGANLNSDNRGPKDQRNVESNRADLIYFNSTITSPFTITGRIWAHLYITSNCTDTDFTVKLTDTYPDGRNMLICDGILRMRSREGQDKVVFMDGSGTTVYEAWIDLWSTSYVFNTGHTLSIGISSSNYPRFDVNPNTGGTIMPFNSTTPANYAKNSVVISNDYPSSLILPVPTTAPHFV